MKEMGMKMLRAYPAEQRRQVSAEMHKFGGALVVLCADLLSTANAHAGCSKLSSLQYAVARAHDGQSAVLRGQRQSRCCWLEQRSRARVRTIYTPDLRQADFGLEPPAQAGIEQQAKYADIAVEENGRISNLCDQSIYLYAECPPYVSAAMLAITAT